VLWEPAAWEESRLGRFALRLEADYGVDLGRDYEALRAWSLEHLDTFWLEVWRELRLPAAPEPTMMTSWERFSAIGFPFVSSEVETPRDLESRRWASRLRSMQTEREASHSPRGSG
jgi:hypothetical protein